MTNPLKKPEMVGFFEKDRQGPYEQEGLSILL
jgi:hypothetical protein